MSGLRADQQRASHAYACVRGVKPADRDDYENAVLKLGINVLRSGLCGALATLQRDTNRPAVRQLFKDLAGAGVPGLSVSAEDGAAPEEALPTKARGLPVEDYMLATRELLQVVQWFKRATQAVFQSP